MVDWTRRFATWLARAHGDKTLQEIANMLGTSKQQIYAWKLGSYTPRPEVRMRIQRLSKGAVKAGDIS